MNLTLDFEPTPKMCASAGLEDNTHPTPVNETKKREELIRFDDVVVGPRVDEDERPIGSSTVQVSERRFRILGKTTKGWWIDDHYEGRKRWIASGAKKAFAHPDRERALNAFIARKRGQAAILRKRADLADQARDQGLGILAAQK